MSDFRDQVYERLPDVLADIVRDYVRPEFELAEFLRDDLKILVIGEMEPEILKSLPRDRRYKLGMFSIRWLIHKKGEIWTYDPIILLDDCRSG